MTNEAVPKVGINRDAPKHAMDVNGVTQAEQYIGKGNVWNSSNITFGTGAGTGPTLSTIIGSNNAFTIVFTTGTAPTANGIVFTASFPKSFPAGFTQATFSPYSTNASATDYNKFKISSAALNQTQLSAVGTLSASTSYGFMFTVNGYDA